MKRAGAASLVLPFGGVLAACGSSDSGATGSGDLLSRMKQTGVARLAIANEPPYTKVTADGQTTGVEPDIAKAVLKRMGIDRVEGVITPYESMIPGLKANRWDMITAGLFMKQSRCSQIEYSEPVLVSTESFAVPVGNPKSLKTIADLKRNGDVKVAVIGGGFEDGIVQEAQLPGSQIVKVPDARSGIEALGAGRADAFLLPTLSLEALKDTSVDFEVTPFIPDAPKTGSGAGFRKGDSAFVREYNAELRKFKQTPEYAELLTKWGFDPEAVRGVTREELCRNPG